MRSSIVLSGFLSTAILAHPFHMHHKRDNGAQLTNTWTQDGVYYEEYTKTIVVDAPDTPAAPAAPAVPSPVKQVVAAPAPKTQEKMDVPVVDQGNTNQAPANPPPAAAASPVASTSTGGSCSGESIGGPAWTASACSGGKTIVDQFNQMRAQWMDSTAGHPYTWDDQLAQNAHDTAWQAENEAVSMVHKLFAGSMGQCIAGSVSNTNIFYNAAKMWMCEIKQGPFCDTQTYSAAGSSTGHADIIKDTTKTKVGCYFMNKNNDPNSSEGMYTCDFA